MQAGKVGAHPNVLAVPQRIALLLWHREPDIET
jgi:hypothetical protein